MATGRRSLVMGWLYADLLLVLLIASLAGMAVTSGAGSQQAPVPAPSADGEAVPRGLDVDPVTMSIKVDADGLLRGRDSVERRFRKDFSKEWERELAKREIDPDDAVIGFAITFGYDKVLGRAQDIARSANAQASKAEPAAFRSSALKNYGNTSAKEDPDHVTFEIYLLVGAGQ